LPTLAIVTRRAAFDPADRVFTDGYRPTVVVPADADPERVAATRALADVIEAGTGSVDLGAALDAFGPGRVLCEGGPTLNGQLAAVDLLDELCLTIAGSLVGGRSGGLLGSGVLDEPLDLTLVGAHQREGDLFLRYRRADRPERGDGPGFEEGEGQAAFDELVGDLDGPMMIVTAAADGERSGCLVGFGSQASIKPGRFGVWLSKANHTYGVAMRSDVLVVHFPSAADRELAALFGETTGDHIDKFEWCRWHEGPDGVPVLDELRRWFAGRVLDRVDTGDHTLVVLAPFAGEAGPWPGGQLGLQAVLDLDAGHPA
jgi:flavin reductase (DIM6/NTAB) family NADH-FMN oxidoreductase RutF